jgi:hypothetical protein
MRLKLQSAPFVDVLSGVVAVVTFDAGGDTKIVKRFPVSYDTNDSGNPCFTNPERDLVPDSSRKSIIYFEDMGLSRTITDGRRTYQSRLRLVAWLNRTRLVAGRYTEIAGRVMADIISRLETTGKLENFDIFQRFNTQVANIPPVSPALFGQYNYDETIRQHLRPPYEYFAIDLLTTFEVRINCLEELTWEVQACPE